MTGSGVLEPLWDLVMELEVVGKFLVVLDIVIIHIDGQKRTRIGFKMIYYLLFYSIIFLSFLLFDRFSKIGWSSVKISFFSLFSSVVILLFWNFFLSSFFFDLETLGSGVSMVLSSIFSIIELFVYSSLFCIALYFYRRMAK